MALTGSQKEYLRGLAHNIEPVVLVGAVGVTEGLLDNVREQIAIHELIKIKFISTKDRAQKKEQQEQIAREASAEIVGAIGHCAILFAPSTDESKRKIQLPRMRQPKSDE